MPISPAQKEKIKRFYMEGNYVYLSEVAEKFNVSLDTLYSWIEEEDWTAQRKQLWTRLKNNEDIENDIKQRRINHIKAWNAILNQAIQHLRQAQEQGTPLDVKTINTLAQILEKVQRGHYFADHIPEAQEDRAVEVQYTGLRELILQQRGNGDDWKKKMLGPGNNGGK